MERLCEAHLAEKPCAFCRAHQRWVATTFAKFFGAAMVIGIALVEVLTLLVPAP